MNHDLLKRKFERIGARVAFRGGANRTRSAGAITLDVDRDARGECFVVRQRDVTRDLSLEVLDVQPNDRHLLLMVRDGVEKPRFLCGHDERHWFVAAIPEGAGASTVRAAKEALKPRPVRDAEIRARVTSGQRDKRKNAAFVRQGEWFFLPDPALIVDPKLVRFGEPLSRGNGGKPHWAEFCYRTGGEQVYVCDRKPGVFSEARYHQVLQQKPEARAWGWRSMRRNPGVYVRGRVRHADHKTITLRSWHRVLMNTENEAKALQHLAFLD